MVPLSLAVFAVCLQSLLSISFYLHYCNIWTSSRQSASKGNYNYLVIIFGFINQNFIDDDLRHWILSWTLVFRYFTHKHSIFILIVFSIFLRFPLSIKRACFPRFQSTWISCDIYFGQKFSLLYRELFFRYYNDTTAAIAYVVFINIYHSSWHKHRKKQRKILNAHQFRVIGVVFATLYRGTRTILTDPEYPPKFSGLPYLN